jgi:hypothetical protein
MSTFEIPAPPPPILVDMECEKCGYELRVPAECVALLLHNGCFGHIVPRRPDYTIKLTVRSKRLGSMADAEIAVPKIDLLELAPDEFVNRYLVPALASAQQRALQLERPAFTQDELDEATENA